MIFVSNYVAKLNDDCLFSLLIGVMSSFFSWGSGMTGAKEENKGEEKKKEICQRYTYLFSIYSSRIKLSLMHLELF